MNTATMRKYVIWALLLVTVYLVFDASRQQQESADLSAPVGVDRRPESRAAEVDVIPVPGLSRRKWQEQSAGDPFRTMAWYTPPRIEPEPPPAPVAPPLPFVYFGKMAEGEQPYAFLQKGSVVQVVKPGDVLDNKYRVDSVTSQAVTLIYLPLNTLQVAVLGARPALAQPADVIENLETGEAAGPPADEKKKIRLPPMPTNNGEIPNTGVAEAGNTQEQ